MDMQTSAPDLDRAPDRPDDAPRVLATGAPGGSGADLATVVAELERLERLADALDARLDERLDERGHPVPDAAAVP